MTTTTALTRPWRRLDQTILREAVSQSRLCRHETWPDDIDDLCRLCMSELSVTLDRILPLQPKVHRKRPSDPWFDVECRQAKLETRRLERRHAAACRRCRPFTGPVSGSNVYKAVVDIAATKAAWYAQRRLYRRLRQEKSSEFWRKQVEEHRSNPRQLWRTVDQLLGRGKPPSTDVIGVEQFRTFFDGRVNRIRDATSCASSPSYSTAPTNAQLPSFRDVTLVEVMTFIGRLPDKSSAVDPLPTKVLKDISDLVAPYISELFNRSLSAGHYPSDFKHAFITPIVKAGKDPTDVESYRLIAKLSVLSKLFERMIAHQIWGHPLQFNLLPAVQSGFRPGHSTESAILHVLSDLLDAVDRGDFAMLTLLDLSTAFNTVDHHILLERLRRSFGFTDSALAWITSYLSGRTECVRRGDSCSTMTTLTCGVPQGSVLGPVMFIMYTADLPSIVQQHGLSLHLYADDTQIYGSCRPDDTNQLTEVVQHCLDDVAAWMQSNRLQLNSDKTEVMWFTTQRRQQQLPVSAIRVNGSDVLPVSSARNLGVYFDSALSMRRHINVITARCYTVLRQLRAIRRYVQPSVMQSLVTALMLTRLDYCNSVLFGLPSSSIRRLQTVQNAAARLVFNIRRYDHVTDSLICLHWLRVAERIRFKMAVLAYRSINGQPPSYLHGFTAYQAGYSCLRSASSTSSSRLVVPRTRLSSVGSRSFLVAGANVWNELPPDITSAPSLSIFKSRLKTHLFTFSFPGLTA